MRLRKQNKNNKVNQEMLRSSFSSNRWRSDRSSSQTTKKRNPPIEQESSKSALVTKNPFSSVIPVLTSQTDIMRELLTMRKDVLEAIESVLRKVSRVENGLNDVITFKQNVEDNFERYKEERESKAKFNSEDYFNYQKELTLLRSDFEQKISTLSQQVDSNIKFILNKISELDVKIVSVEQNRLMEKMTSEKRKIDEDIITNVGREGNEDEVETIEDDRTERDIEEDRTEKAPEVLVSKIDSLKDDASERLETEYLDAGDTNISEPVDYIESDAVIEGGRLSTFINSIVGQTIIKFKRIRCKKQTIQYQVIQKENIFVVEGELYTVGEYSYLKFVKITEGSNFNIEQEYTVKIDSNIINE